MFAVERSRMMDVQHTVALVTGGGTGIGRATSLALARRGVAVGVNYSRSQEEAQTTVRQIEEQGGRAVALQADVSQDAQVRAMVAELASQFGSVDLLVNNASITRYISLSDLEAVTEEAWDALYSVNVKGMFYCARAVAPLMKQRGRGAIVNVGSIAGLTGAGSSLPYAVSKGAIHTLTKALARALAPEIRVCSVAPGAVNTRWWAHNQELMAQLTTSVPLQRLATPEDIAEMICALLTQEAITGQIVTVDSGQIL